MFNKRKQFVRGLNKAKHTTGTQRAKIDIAATFKHSYKRLSKL